jgi:hypothetical protein
MNTTVAALSVSVHSGVFPRVRVRRSGAGIPFRFVHELASNVAGVDGDHDVCTRRRELVAGMLPPSAREVGG